MSIFVHLATLVATLIDAAKKGGKSGNDKEVEGDIRMNQRSI
jgi:hypothetical protein